MNNKKKVFICILINSDTVHNYVQNIVSGLTSTVIKARLDGQVVLNCAGYPETNDPCRFKFPSLWETIRSYLNDGLMRLFIPNLDSVIVTDQGRLTSWRTVDEETYDTSAGEMAGHISEENVQSDAEDEYEDEVVNENLNETSTPPDPKTGPIVLGKLSHGQ